MKKIIENILGYVVVILVGVASVVYISSNVDLSEKFLGGPFSDKNTINLIGSSSNLVSLPVTGVNANATTTDSGGTLEDGGSTLQQDIDTTGVRKVVLNIEAIGSVSTSTIHIRQQGSFNGSDFFDLATSTAIFTSTSTPSSITPRGITIQPGLASTSIALPFSIDGYQKTRFVIYGEQDGELNLGVQAWITATIIKDRAN